MKIVVEQFVRDARMGMRIEVADGEVPWDQAEALKWTLNELLPYRFGRALPCRVEIDEHGDVTHDGKLVLGYGSGRVVYPTGPR